MAICKECGKEVKHLRDDKCNTCYIVAKNETKVKNSKPKKRLKDYSKEEIELQLYNAELIRRAAACYKADAERDKRRMQSAK